MCFNGFSSKRAEIGRHRGRQGEELEVLANCRERLEKIETGWWIWGDTVSDGSSKTRDTALYRFTGRLSRKLTGKSEIQAQKGNLMTWWRSERRIPPCSQFVSTRLQIGKNFHNSPLAAFLSERLQSHYHYLSQFILEVTTSKKSSST